MMIRSFASAYARKQGYIAARKTSWLAIPLLIIVVLFGLAEMGIVPGLSHMLPDVQHMMRALR
jgi:hypothetical protein